MLDLLSGQPTELTQLEMVRSKPVPFPPEPLAYLGVQATRWSLARADRHSGRRNLWLRALDGPAWASTPSVFSSVAAGEAERRAARSGSQRQPW